MAVFVRGNVVLCGFSQSVTLTTLTRLSQPHLHTQPDRPPQALSAPQSSRPAHSVRPPPHALSITLGPALLAFRVLADAQVSPASHSHPLHPTHTALPCLALCLIPLSGYLFHSCQRFTFLPSPRKLPNCTISQTRGVSGPWGAMDYPMDSQAHVGLHNRLQGALEHPTAPTAMPWPRRGRNGPSLAVMGRSGDFPGHAHVHLPPPSPAGGSGRARWVFTGPLNAAPIRGSHLSPLRFLHVPPWAQNRGALPRLLPSGPGPRSRNRLQGLPGAPMRSGLWGSCPPKGGSDFTEHLAGLPGRVPLCRGHRRSLGPAGGFSGPPAPARHRRQRHRPGTRSPSTH